MRMNLHGARILKRLGDITRELCRAAWVKKKAERVGIAAMGSTLPFPPGAQVIKTGNPTDIAALRPSQRQPGVTVKGTPTGGDGGEAVGAAYVLGGNSAREKCL